jgi:hypothetical protein
VAWQQELATANDAQLTALLTASHEQLATAHFVCDTMTARDQPPRLVELVTLCPADVARRWPGFSAWQCHWWWCGGESALRGVTAADNGTGRTLCSPKCGPRGF